MEIKEQQAKADILEEATDAFNQRQAAIDNIDSGSRHMNFGRMIGLRSAAGYVYGRGSDIYNQIDALIEKASAYKGE